MVGELDILSEWIPEQMQPGTIFVLENAGEVGEKEDPYWAVLACPSCGMLGLITRRQINGLIPVICGSEHCSAQFFIREAKSSCANRSSLCSMWSGRPRPLLKVSLHADSAQLHRNLIDDLDPESFERSHTFGPVRE